MHGLGNEKREMRLVWALGKKAARHGGERGWRANTRAVPSVLDASLPNDPSSRSRAAFFGAHYSWSLAMRLDSTSSTSAVGILG